MPCVPGVVEYKTAYIMQFGLSISHHYGPFKVIRQTSEVTYELDLPKASNIHPIFHVALLKPVTSLKDLRAPALPKGEDGDELLETAYRCAFR